MDKVRKYIEDYTLRCSNELVFGGFQPWLKPYHAEAVAQIAREEVVEKAVEWLENNLQDYRYIDNWGSANIDVDLVIMGFRKAMEE